MRIGTECMSMDLWDYWAIRVWQDRQFALQIGRAVGCVPAVRIPPAPAFTVEQLTAVAKIVTDSATLAADAAAITSLFPTAA